MRIQWIALESATQLHQIIRDSVDRPVIIYKHSTRCSVSSMVLGRLERSCDLFEEADAYFLDVLAFRPVSSMVAELFSVPHESPQLLLIRDNNVVFDQSHFGIDPSAIGEQLAKSRIPPVV